MSLYQKHRPESFDEMIGNEEQVENLAEMLQRKNKPHVYLFSGESGCGKTTAARIAAKIVGAGELSIREINSSNNRGIDTARDIIESMRSLPLDGDASVFILDECHRFTKEFSDAMLKATEDTPDHVYFFLCTTAPGKMMPTLRKRCQVFNFKPIPAEYLKRLVRGVAKKECYDLSAEVYEEISEQAQGSARTALIMLEKVGNLPSDKALKLVAGYVDEEDVEIVELCRSLINKEPWKNISDILNKIKDKDPEEIRRSVLGYMAGALLRGKTDARAALVLEFFSEPFYDSGFSGVVLGCWQVIST